MQSILRYTSRATFQPYPCATQAQARQAWPQYSVFAPFSYVSGCSASLSVVSTPSSRGCHCVEGSLPNESYSNCSPCGYASLGSLYKHIQCSPGGRSIVLINTTCCVPSGVGSEPALRRVHLGRSHQAVLAQRYPIHWYSYVPPSPSVV